MTDHLQFLVKSFPVVIDPLSGCLEIEMRVSDECSSDGFGPAKHFRLQRLAVRHDTLPMFSDTSAVHFFGLHAEAERCPFILAYDSSGVIRKRLNWSPQDKTFEVFSIPEEVNGRAVIRSGVRVLFRNSQEASTYYDIVRLAQEGRSCPEHGEVLLKLLSRGVGLTMFPSAIVGGSSDG